MGNTYFSVRRTGNLCIAIYRLEIFTREITDSRGNPAFEAEVLAGEDIVGRASVSAGILAEGYEAARSRDWKNGNMERTMEQAVESVNAHVSAGYTGAECI